MTKKILIADDSLFMRMIIKKILQPLGNKIKIFEASCGREAIEIYKKEKPDIITLDITMPKLTGYEALKEIRKEDKDVVILMCSSMVYKDNITEVMEAGANDFILKPFQNEDFLKKILSYL